MDLRGATAVVTGGAGFIGSHLVDALVARGSRVTVYDNLSTGSPSFLGHLARNPGVRFVQGDVLDARSLRPAITGSDIVFHVAADPDVRTSFERTAEHMRQNVTATNTVLDVMRDAGVKRIAFTSTSTVYGEAAIIPTPEGYGPLEPISVYGAAKLGAESLIAAYCHTFDFQGASFRFANVVGPRSTHGVTYDFIHKLRANPKRLEILGDGKQTKSYVSVADTVEGLLHAVERQTRKYDVYNIGSEDAVDVKSIADICASVLGLKDVEYRYTGGVDGRGWRGDVKVMRLAIDKLKGLGWKPRHTSADAIRLAAVATAADQG
ncbi:MAG TPA: NAD-dependent epimerase/dehydratase family protein [Candidatus Thermoplasmatota archaeon]|nr:NAD-dependent epimerase/dehydratase family protein [Candidatus Thermoplasmatota archaeon]